MAYRIGPIFWGLVLIGLGALFLAQPLSGGTFDVGEFLGRWWPALLVLLGLWLVLQAFVERRWWAGRPAGWAAGGWATGGRSETLSLDLAGAPSARVEVAFGAGELLVGRAPAGKLVEGTFDGGVRPEIRGPGHLRLGREMPPWGWGPGRWAHGWRFGVTGDVPLALTVETGASRNDLDLTELRVTELVVRTGAAETIVRLPRESGVTQARIDAGAASIRVLVPPEVALRVHGRMQIGTNDIDTRRFPPTPTGWSSPDFEIAKNRVELAITGGLATLRVL